MFLLRPQLARLLATPVPTPPCVEPTLSVGAAQFHIQSIARLADGSLSFPADSDGVAYWVEGTSPQYVFALSPAPDHLKLAAALKQGEVAKIAWADCTSELYAVSAIEVADASAPGFFEAPGAGLTVFVQADPSGTGMAIRAERPEAFSPSPEAPEPTDENAIQIDIEFLDTTPSADGKTVTIGMKITNRGAKPLALSDCDLALTPENGNPSPPTNVEPALPVEIQPEAELTVSVSFPMPATPSAVLRILQFTVEYYFQ